MPSIAIELQDVRRTYRVGNADVHALHGAELQVASGEFLAIVGVSGSGKSTLLHVIGGLDSPSAGRVLVRGDDVASMSAQQKTEYRRTMVGFVFQSFFLLPHLTAEENLQLALTMQGIYGLERSKRARNSIERVGLAHRARHKPSQLSGGEQQRVAVARAIVNRPRILLADEPTGNLDQATAHELMTLLRDISNDAEMTVLVVTHDEALVRQFCDRLVRMRDGKFVEQQLLHDVWHRAGGANNG
ncbi:MAG: ABC transporter ATP-binding protein [Planctomycetales bacterium]|nr:ABC transporter ATP-binding protein [Planctomycetales bacterium]